ncbi:MAG TPA: transporter [Saprospiraceae bacterium]|nr:transporter [Saprospiraceae bacterium]
MKNLIINTIIFFLANSLAAQTCCSGGVPVSSNLGLPASDGKTIQFNLSYDLNVLRTLKSGKEILDDHSRDRKTHAVLLELGYSFTDRFSVDGFFSFVRQERTVNQFGNTDFTFTQGVGDAIVLFKYKLLALKNNQTTWLGGLGIKAPLGASDLRNRETGIWLNADLQPGSGAWDAILWSQFTQVTSFRPSMSFVSTLTYGIKGKNPAYFGTQVYQFGNELQISMGLSDRLLIGKSIVDPALLFRYRTVQADRNNNNDLPSTGGQWVFINPSITYWINSDMSFNINGELPLYSKLEGTQVTPTFRWNIGFFYRISLRKANSNNQTFKMK